MVARRSRVMRSQVGGVVYWDSSAVLSALFRDEHSTGAGKRASEPAVHLLSTLAWAEVLAVIARIERERVLAKVLVAAAREALEEGPWRRLNAVPDWREVRRLSTKWPLRGADLWHLAVVKSLQAELPELTFMSFDTRLAAAAHGEGFA